MCSIAKSPEAQRCKKPKCHPQLLWNAAFKPLSTNLSAHKNKAAYQTPKYFQLPNKNDEKMSSATNTKFTFFAEGDLRPSAGGPLSTLKKG